MDTGPKIIFSLPFFLGLSVVWALVWAWIGWLLCDRRCPKRAIFVEDSGAWTIGKLEATNFREDGITEQSAGLS